MTQRFEILENGVVVKTIIADLDFMQKNHAGNFCEAAQEAAAPTVQSWHITKLAFRQRFTPDEKGNINLAAAANTLQGAKLKASLDDQQAALFIDLKRPDTRAAVQGLEAATLIGAGRAAIILDTPPTEIELYRG
jgi:hypothetical protein